MPVLANRNAIITGASQGLGAAIAEAYVEAGANVLLCARNAEKLEETRARLADKAEPGRIIAACATDVSEEKAVAGLVEQALSLFGQVHILVNNAGIYGPKGLIEDVDWQQWAKAMEINLYGSILPCRQILPHLRKQKYGKIVQLSGGGATNPLPRLSAYAASKAAVVRFAETLAEETRDDHIDVNCIAPGALNTRMLDEVLDAGPEVIGQAFYQKMMKVKEKGGTPLTVGAGLAVYLASDASDGITGKLFSAQWDPWETMHEHKDEIAGNDIYTLRRIVPADRRLDWGERS